MKLGSSKFAVAGVLAVVVLAGAFWALVLSPKRDEASKLDAHAKQVKAALAQHRSEIATAEEARADFPAEYQRLVVLGKAVPGDDDTASLLVEVNQIADRAGVRFSGLELTSGSAAEVSAPTPAPAPEGSATSASSPISPTEVAASTLPLGATVGPAGLGVMPYTLTFDGNFFAVADFITGLDSLVETRNEKVTVDGRLLTIDGFSLVAAKAGFPSLQATFAVTTYLTPPDQGLTGGASPESPGPAEATPASTTIGVAR